MGAKKILHLFSFSTTSTLNGEYLLNETWHRQSGKGAGKYEGSPILQRVKKSTVLTRFSTALTLVWQSCRIAAIYLKMSVYLKFIYNLKQMVKSVNLPLTTNLFYFDPLNSENKVGGFCNFHMRRRKRRPPANANVVVAISALSSFG